MNVKHAIIGTYGEVEGTSMTPSYQTVASADDDVSHVFVFNNTNKPIILSFDGGTTDHFKLIGETFAWDVVSNRKILRAPVVVQVKHAGTAPTSGSLRITLVK